MVFQNIYYHRPVKKTPVILIRMLRMKYYWGGLGNIDIAFMEHFIHRYIVIESKYPVILTRIAEEELFEYVTEFDPSGI